MGYCYQSNLLVCDRCAVAGGVRKRACTFKVLGTAHRKADGKRHLLPYCPPPALCGPCLKAVGGTKALHAGCAEGAARQQAEADATEILYQSGAPIRCAAWGSWEDGVPAGKAKVLFRTKGGTESYYLVDSAEYQAVGLGRATTVTDYRTATPFVEVAA